MIKKEIYPKTVRIKENGNQIQITEKLDGSNLIIFKLENKLYIAQRKTIICFDELDACKDVLYKGLYQWLIDNKDSFDLYEGSAVCGEWLGMGQIKYTIDEFDKRFYMFAKANIDEDFNLFNIMYDHDLFIYPFESQKIPKCTGIVPVVMNLHVLPTKNHLDSIYEKYCEKVNRKVEGFVINYNNDVNKYVRMKNGKLIEYSSHDHKGEQNG